VSGGQYNKTYRALIHTLPCVFVTVYSNSINMGRSLPLRDSTLYDSALVLKYQNWTKVTKIDE